MTMATYFLFSQDSEAPPTGPQSHTSNSSSSQQSGEEALAEAFNKSLSVKANSSYDSDLEGTITSSSDQAGIPSRGTQMQLQQGVSGPGGALRQPIKSRLKPSDSSFGLHSPDNLPVGFIPQEGEVQVSLEKSQL